MLKMRLNCLFIGLNLLLQNMSFAQTYFANPTEVKFLKAEEAFRGDLIDIPKLVVSWQISPGYYLYKKSFEIKLLNKNAAVISSSNKNFYSVDGEIVSDEFMGKTTIFKNYVEISPTFSSKDAQDAHFLEVSYQGCAQGGLCYPPKKIKFPIH